MKTMLLAVLALAVTLSMTMPPKAWAMLAPAQESPAPSANTGLDRASDLKTIQATLDNEMVRKKLADYKLTPEQIQQRLNQMSNEQIHQTAMQIKTLNPGGDGGLGILVTVLVIGVLVLLFVYLFKRV